MGGHDPRVSTLPKWDEEMSLAVVLPMFHLPPSTVPNMAKAGITPATTKAHRRALRLLQGCKEPHLAVTTAALLVINMERKARAWRWTTTCTMMGNMQGALRYAPMYCAAPSIMIGRSPMWTMATRAATRLAAAEIPKQAHPAKLDDVIHVANMQAPPGMTQERWIHVRALIVVAFLSAQRPLCLMRARTGEVTIAEGGAELKVTVRRGKTVVQRGPYCVFSAVPPPLQAVLGEWERAKGLPKTPAFMANGAEVRQALRRVDPLLEQRSLRRGAIQALSASGVPATEVKEFSGHATMKSLTRYLDFGAKDAPRHQRMVAAAATAFVQQ